MFNSDLNDLDVVKKAINGQCGNDVAVDSVIRLSEKLDALKSRSGWFDGVQLSPFVNKIAETAGAAASC